MYPFLLSILIICCLATFNLFWWSQVWVYCSTSEAAYYILKVQFFFIRRVDALLLSLLNELEVLYDYYSDEIVQWLVEFVVPAPDLAELFYAEVQELGYQLWLEHVVYAVVGLDVLELEPERHYFIIEMGAWLYELYIQVIGAVSGIWSCNLDLLFNDLLFSL